MDPSGLARTRMAYEKVAVDYAALLHDELDGKPLDRALLTAFGERVQHSGGGLVGDIGCGPGRIAGFLHTLGVETLGIDLSPAMIAVAQSSYPQLSFQVGAMASLDLADGSLGAVVAWYSIIHTPPELLPDVFTEFRRVLRADGQLLLAFQGGDGPTRITRAYGHQVSLDVYRSRPERIRELLDQAGFVIDTSVCREPVAHESSRQAYMFAVRGR